MPELALPKHPPFDAYSLEVAPWDYADDCILAQALVGPNVLRTLAGRDAAADLGVPVDMLDDPGPHLLEVAWRFDDDQNKFGPVEILLHINTDPNCHPDLLTISWKDIMADFDEINRTFTVLNIKARVDRCSPVGSP